jgi:hypothetical protein
MRNEETIDPQEASPLNHGSVLVPPSSVIPVYSEGSVDRSQCRKLEAVVLGNGPSLRGFDFHRLSRFDVFGMNAAYRYWYDIGWFPQYYSCLDLVVGASHRDAIIELIRDSDRLGIRAFLLRQPLIDNLGDVATSPKVFNFDLLRPGFESWIPGPVTTGSHTCAWASTLGYENIYLLGVDSNYVEVVPHAEQRDDSVFEIITDAPNPNYFFDSYQRKGDKYNIPNPRKDLHLESWRNVGEKLPSRSRVLNANLASRVDAFPFVHFDDVEKGGKIPVYSPSQVISGAPLDAPVDYVLVPYRAATAAPLPTPSSARPHPTSEDFKKLPSILSYDAEWQSPEFTEKHAFSQAVKFLPEVPGVLYFGFPWATLIDMLQSNRPEGNRLIAVLASTKHLTKDKKHVITVCQHKDLPGYQNIFTEAGITHVFWPYAGQGQDCFPEYNDIKVSPFPLAPVPMRDYQSSEAEGKKHLYAFIEPKTKGPDASKSIELILRHLAGNRCGVVIARSQWDFENILGDQMPAGQAAPQEGHPGGPVPIEPWRILEASLFSLCPSGPNPNSARLWESIGCGAIPVIFGDTHFLPGSKALWDQATVLCSERPEDILALPDHLETLSRDTALLERKRHAMRQLWMLYGPDFFIYDIYKLFLELAQENIEIRDYRSTPSYGRLLAMASVINRGRNVGQAELDAFILDCSSRVIVDPSGLKSRLEDDTAFRMAYENALRSCNPVYAESMRRNLKFKAIGLN